MDSVMGRRGPSTRILQAQGEAIYNKCTKNAIEIREAREEARARQENSERNIRNLCKANKVPYAAPPPYPELPSDGDDDEDIFNFTKKATRQEESDEDTEAEGEGEEEEEEESEEEDAAAGSDDDEIDWLLLIDEYKNEVKDLAIMENKLGQSCLLCNGGYLGDIKAIPISSVPPRPKPPNLARTPPTALYNTAQPPPPYALGARLLLAPRLSILHHLCAVPKPTQKPSPFIFFPKPGKVRRCSELPSSLLARCRRRGRRQRGASGDFVNLEDLPAQSSKILIELGWNGLKHVASDEIHIAITGDVLADDMRKV
ncbi:hypothetical protein EJB05_55835, partial [Eragrostis curvula]